MNESYRYQSEELDFFADAHNYREYWKSRIEPFLDGGFSIEIGSGIGSNCNFISKKPNEYLGIEPDQILVKEAQRRFPSFTFRQGISETCKEIGNADQIYYLDVLEHIKDDVSEIQSTINRMKPGARLLILVPGHPFLYSEFDKYVGHWRRYTFQSLQSIMPSALKVIRLEYLDSVGFLLSLISNKVFKGKMLNRTSVRLWNLLIPLSRVIDMFTFRKLGKSILLIGEKVMH